MNRVVETINRMNSQVMSKRSPAFGAQLFRKRLLRTSPSSVGGIPTLGGVAVLSSTDEENFDYQFLGNARVMRIADYAPSLMIDRMDTHNSGGNGNEHRFIIEPEAPSGSPDWFAPKVHDVMYLWTDSAGTVKVGFEIVGVEAVNNLAPYSVRYVCNRRADLDL